MRYFTRLQIENFRRLQSVDLELRPLGVLIGATGSGKTSLLDVFTLLADVAQGRLKEWMSASGGLTANLTARDAPWLGIRLSAITRTGRPLHYRVAFKPRGPAYTVVNESLFSQPDPSSSQTPADSEGGPTQYWIPFGNPYETAVLEAPRLPAAGEAALSKLPVLDGDPAEFQRRVAGIERYRGLNVGPLGPRQSPPAADPTARTAGDPADLAAGLRALRDKHPDRFAVLEDTLRAAFPAFERLDFPPTAAGASALAWRERGFQRPFAIEELSAGVRRFLELTALLLAADPPAVTLLEIPESGLHPELVGLLAELLREAAARTQLLVTTHSDRLIRSLKPEEVLVMDVDGTGRATAQWGERLDLAAWLTKYTAPRAGREA